MRSVHVYTYHRCMDHAVRCININSTSRHRNQEDRMIPTRERQDAKTTRKIEKNRTKNGKRKQREDKKNKKIEQKKQKRKHTREYADLRILKVCPLREGCRTEIMTKNKHTYSATKHTSEAKKNLLIIDEKRKGRRRSKKSKKQKGKRKIHRNIEGQTGRKLYLLLLLQ